MPKARVVLAAPKSGSGKTLITCALLSALKARALKVRAFKCGPDYIDPMFHEKVIGVSSQNLDLFFSEPEEVRQLFCLENDSDISVVEGVMGVYDGLGGVLEEASTYQLAEVLDAPIVLVINAKGMGRSLLAEIMGFKALDTGNRIKGVILNQTSKMLYERVRPMIEETCKVRVLGYFPDRQSLHWDSRHLGLKLPGEIGELKRMVREAAELLEECVEMDVLLQIAKTASTLPFIKSKESPTQIRIAVAYDEAFCFYYENNLRILRELGAELVFFSPLHDRELPKDIQGLILGGGYPELMADKLSANTTMLASIRKAIESGILSVAECGGFMYLHEAIVEEGKRYPMVGVVPGVCFNTGKLVRFGYATFSLPNGLTMRGHEFHYYESENPGEDVVAVKPYTGKSYRCMYFDKTHLWGYGHLHYTREFGGRFFFHKECPCVTERGKE